MQAPFGIRISDLKSLGNPGYYQCPNTFGVWELKGPLDCLFHIDRFIRFNTVFELYEFFSELAKHEPKIQEAILLWVYYPTKGWFPICGGDKMPTYEPVAFSDHCMVAVQGIPGTTPTTQLMLEMERKVAQAAEAAEVDAYGSNEAYLYPELVSE